MALPLVNALGTGPTRHVTNSILIAGRGSGGIAPASRSSHIVANCSAVDVDCCGDGGVSLPGGKQVDGVTLHQRESAGRARSQFVAFRRKPGGNSLEWMGFASL